LILESHLLWLLMTLKALEVLKKELKILQAQVKAKKEKLQAQLHERKSISSHDEKWLDNEGNLVDEQRVLDALENASDYERGLERLDDVQKGAVKRLREVAGDLSKVVGKKRKRTLMNWNFSIHCSNRPT
jgi:hypothetical protein